MINLWHDVFLHFLAQSLNVLEDKRHHVLLQLRLNQTWQVLLKVLVDASIKFNLLGLLVLKLILHLLKLLSQLMVLLLEIIEAFDHLLLNSYLPFLLA
jgi:hypothetical protein